MKTKKSKIIALSLISAAIVATILWLSSAFQYSSVAVDNIDNTAKVPQIAQISRKGVPKDTELRLDKLSVESKEIRLVSNAGIIKNTSEGIRSDESSKNLAYEARTRRLEVLSRQYGLRFLPASVLTSYEEGSVLKSSRILLERQLVRNSNDSQLIALANQVGVDEGLTKVYKAQKRSATYSDKYDNRVAEVEARKTRNVHQKEYALANKKLGRRENSSLRGKGSSQKTISTTQHAESNNTAFKQNQSNDQLRKKIIRATASRLAKLQIQQLGIDN